MRITPFLSATVAALGLSTLSASAASVYEATQSLTVTLIRGDDDVAITYEPEPGYVVTQAFGDFGTGSLAAELGTNVDIGLNVGGSFSLTHTAKGTATNGALFNLAVSEASRTGKLTLENTSQVATQILFDILYDLKWLATVDDPLTETATAEVFWEILLGNTTLFSRSFMADAVAGLPGGNDANAPNTLQLLVELDPFETEEYTIRATSKGQATTTPAAVPLPAAGGLLIAGLGGLALAARRGAA